MRLSAADGHSHLYTVYDHLAKCVRHDICWADDFMNQLGVGFASGGREFVYQIEQRKRVLIVTALKLVAVDLPEDEVEEKELEYVYANRGERETHGT